MDDCISRQSVIDCIERYRDEHWSRGYDATDDIEDAVNIRDRVINLPSVQPEHTICYQECANAILKMWLDNVLTDGEYNKIMDKLNKKHDADMRGEQNG